MKSGPQPIKGAKGSSRNQQVQAGSFVPVPVGSYLPPSKISKAELLDIFKEHANRQDERDHKAKERARELASLRIALSRLLTHFPVSPEIVFSDEPPAKCLTTPTSVQDLSPEKSPERNPAPLLRFSPDKLSAGSSMKEMARQHSSVTPTEDLDVDADPLDLGPSAFSRSVIS